jgi:hypothetical protein
VLTATPQRVAAIAADVPGLADALRYTPEEWQKLNQRARYSASLQGRRPAPNEG